MQEKLNKITGVLLVNLGTPDSTSTPDVRKYLREFLSDPRVLDINPVVRTLLLNLVIAPFRSPKSAASYREVWMNEGSPLMVYGKQVRHSLQDSLGPEFHVQLAMRYQSPSIDLALENFRKEGIDHIRVIPMFPHYASASTGSVHEKIMDIVSKWQVIPQISFLKSYHDEPGMIEAFAINGERHKPETYDHIVFSFHGLPVRQLRKSDLSGTYCQANGVCCSNLNETNKNCYAAQCHHTARLLAERLKIDKSNYTISFQSRLGRDPWIRPSTQETVLRLAAEGKKRVLIFCPAFVADCLETLFEVTTELKDEFVAAGGEHVQLVESLNNEPKWIETLVKLAKEVV